MGDASGVFPTEMDIYSNILLGIDALINNKTFWD
jgi:hypothetical protein